MKTLSIVMLGLVATAGLVMADGREYVNITGDQLLDCNPDATPDGGDLGVVPFSQGGACFEAGHILGPVATVTIQDNTLALSSGFYGQDVDGDGFSDEATSAIFCASHELVEGTNWDPAFEVLVWADGPVFGNPALSICGELSATVAGIVSHS